jgi:hypothetical protein
MENLMENIKYWSSLDNSEIDLLTETHRNNLTDDFTHFSNDCFDECIECNNEELFQLIDNISMSAWYMMMFHWIETNGKQHIQDLIRNL